MASMRHVVVLLVLGVVAVHGVLRNYRIPAAEFYRPVELKHTRVKRAASPVAQQPLRDCPCSSNPCLNGAECSSVMGSLPGTVDFLCKCLGQWTGVTCDSCATSPVCSETCLAYSKNNVCNDGGPGSADSACPFGTDCTDCFTRC